MKPNNKQILDQALAQLPQYKAPADIWKSIEQELDKEKGLPHIDRAISQYKADRVQAHLPWEKIEHALENQERLNRAIQSLPVHKLHKDVFENIIEKTQKEKPVRSSPYLYWIAGMAASLLLLLSFLWQNEIPASAEKIHITYREEAIPPTDWQAVYSQLPEEDELMQFIRENCARLAMQCQEPGFRGLLEEYLELHAARQELVNQLQTHREQTQLATYLVRIEKEKTEVGKKLIQHLL
ncbi:hypothetical protein Q0590_24680 [Rhodocytophaga aerolata]|uniref:Anti-sigma factor n=1 Tax=Rhodocytophaga aerolata TaxID=455078 RepID=A0ABT8RBK1_9BACT|nr:hypothetical protein [Rhodocytophaga aerolata]MDO1449495.1 hypothetical protein [Rhodocytophaga aerolata]